MDRKIEKKKWSSQKLAGAIAIVFVSIYLIYAILYRGGNTLNVDSTRIVVSEVISAPFQENITVTGMVVPVRSIFLDAVEGGRIDKVFVEAGSIVNEGDTLLLLSNNNLQLDVMNREAQILEQINTLRSTRLALQQQRLSLRNDYLNHQTELQKREREYQRDKTLFERGLVAQHQFDGSREAYEEVMQRRSLIAEQLSIDSLSIETQFKHIESSLNNMMRNLDLVGRMVDNLIVKAPISGQLTSLDAEIGESKQTGQRLGQIDVTDGYKIRALVDEVYIARLVVGQQAEFDFAGEKFNLTVSRVYPQVSDGRFEIDLDFTESVPEMVRRGQSVRLRLALSDVSQAVLINRGAFYQRTGGNWIFVLDDSGEYAYRRDIRISRQNSQHYVIEEGLLPGEKVLISGYETFGDSERLRIN
jgi:HlyD family secretion protein